MSASRSSSKSSSNSESGGKQRARDVPAVQWLVAGVALVVVVASFGLVLYEGVAGDDAPPVLVVVVDSIAQGSAGFRVHVTVRNTGGRAAADVRVRAELAAGDVADASDIVASGDVPTARDLVDASDIVASGDVATARDVVDASDVVASGDVPTTRDVRAIESGLIRFDLLPPGSRTSGVFVFASDPRAGRLRARVVGHVVP